VILKSHFINVYKDKYPKIKVKVKLKQSHDSPEHALRIPGG